MRIGIILTGFGMADYVDACLKSWISARSQRLEDHEFIICAVSVHFAAFPDSYDDGTIAKLRNFVNSEEIDHLITEPNGIEETKARGLAFEWLKEKDIDIVWQVDIDEQYTEQDISRILRYVENQPYMAAFRISFKNYVFNTKTYLAEPFTPMRIHRMKFGPMEPVGFWADNNMYYKTNTSEHLTRDDSLATIVIPSTCAWVRHITWQSDARSRRKVQYQLARWGNCTFRWDNSKGLVFDPSSIAPRTLSD